MSPEEAAVLAIAYHELGDRANALDHISRAKANLLAGPAPDFWDAEALRLLRCEAERLVLDPAFPADPWAH